MKYQIKFTSQADSDYLETIRYYQEQGTSIAINFDNDLNEILRMIRSSPEMFRRFEEAPFYRRTHLLKFKQQIIYRILEDQNIVLIVSIMHHSRQPDRMTKRLS